MWIITKLKLFKSDIFKSAFFFNFLKQFSDEFFFIYIKIFEENVIKKIKKGYIKKLAKDIKIILRKKKKKKQQYGHEGYKNLSEDEKQKLAEHTKKYYRMRKNDL